MLLTFASSSTCSLTYQSIKEIAALSPTDLQDTGTCACYVRMKEYIENANIKELSSYEELSQKLHQAVNKLICKDTSQWGG